MASAQEHRRKAEADLEKFARSNDRLRTAIEIPPENKGEELDEDIESLTMLKYAVGAIAHALLAMAPEEQGYVSPDEVEN